MDIVRLAGAGLAAVVLGGAAWGQAGPKPSYEQALHAVSQGDCERTETERYIRYYCEKNSSLWYFTHEGRPEHTSYFVAPAYTALRDPYTIVPEHLDGDPIIGGWGTTQSSERSRGAGYSQEEINLRREASRAWMSGIFGVWKADSLQFRPRMKRDSGKLYPLEP